LFLTARPGLGRDKRASVRRFKWLVCRHLVDLVDRIPENRRDINYRQFVTLYGQSLLTEGVDGIRL
jgi:hypothetical protein